MKLTFRQGIVSYDIDSAGNPLFLRTNGDFVDLVVRNIPTTFTIAHFEQDYLFSEPRTALNAWGPFEEGEDYYLYWDVDLLTGELSRGYTTIRPVYLPSTPHPEVDLHWFDLTNNVMKVWSGESWVVRLRVFAAFFANGTYLIPYEQGKSQASIDKVNITAGYPIFDEAEPVRRYRKDNMGVFVHTGTALHPQWSKLANYRLRNAIRESSAVENLPANYAVGYRGVDNVTGLIRHTIPIYSAVGITADAVAQGNYHTFISHGYVTNENWNWDVQGTEPAGSPVFVGNDGSLTTTSPQTGSTQRIGIIVDRNTIYVNVRPIIIFDEEEFTWPTIIFDAGLDQNVICAEQVQLQARIFIGDIANHIFEWEQLAGTPITLEDADTLSPWFLNIGSVDYVFRLWIDRGTPYEQFSDVNIFREITTVTSQVETLSELGPTRSIENARLSSESRIVQNVIVEPITFTDQVGTTQQSLSVCKDGPFFIYWDVPSGENKYNIFLGVDVERWDTNTNQWVFVLFQPRSRRYFNMQNNETYRLVSRWYDVLRRVTTRETDNKPYTGHLNSEWPWIGATSVISTDYTVSLTTPSTVDRLAPVKFVVSDFATNINYIDSLRRIEDISRTTAIKCNEQNVFVVSLSTVSGVNTGDTAITRSNGITVGS